VAFPEILYCSAVYVGDNAKSAVTTSTNASRMVLDSGRGFELAFQKNPGEGSLISSLGALMT